MKWVKTSLWTRRRLARGRAQPRKTRSKSFPLLADADLHPRSLLTRLFLRHDGTQCGFFEVARVALLFAWGDALLPAPRAFRCRLRRTQQAAQPRKTFRYTKNIHTSAIFFVGQLARGAELAARPDGAGPPPFFSSIW